jgi:hypothetical protein
MRYAQDNLTGTALDIGLWWCSHAATFQTIQQVLRCFLINQMGLTLSNYNVKQCELLWYHNQRRSNSSDLNQAGQFFQHNEYNWKKFHLESTKNANNFDNNQFSAGTNTNNSIDQYF